MPIAKGCGTIPVSIGIASKRKASVWKLFFLFRLQAVIA
jgi:hypothetical protein